MSNEKEIAQLFVRRQALVDALYELRSKGEPKASQAAHTWNQRVRSLTRNLDRIDKDLDTVTEKEGHNWRKDITPKQ